MQLPSTKGRSCLFCFVTHTQSLSFISLLSNFSYLSRKFLIKISADRQVIRLQAQNWDVNGIFASSSVYISQVDQCKKNILPEGVVEVRVDSKGRTPHLVCPVHPNTSTPLFSLVLLYVCQRKHRSLKIWPTEAISPAVTRPIAIFCRFA